MLTTMFGSESHASSAVPSANVPIMVLSEVGMLDVKRMYRKGVMSQICEAPAKIEHSFENKNKYYNMIFMYEYFFKVMINYDKI